jgi:hypothetical protein
MSFRSSLLASLVCAVIFAVARAEDPKPNNEPASPKREQPSQQGQQPPRSDKPKPPGRHEVMDYGSVICHTFEYPGTDGKKAAVAKGVAIRLRGADGVEGGALFDAEKCRWVGAWTGGFVNLTGVVFDGKHGPNPSPKAAAGKWVPNTRPEPEGKRKFLGLYRSGDDVLVSYSIDGAPQYETMFLDGADKDGNPLVRFRASGAPVPAKLKPRWEQTIVTQGQLGTGGGAYVVDTLTLPDDNPWKSWLRVGGFDFFADGTRAALSTWSGDVWVVSGIDEQLGSLKWRRYAAGLFQPLGLRIVNGQIYVNCRDGLYRLDDLNHDGEADFYAVVNYDVIVTPSFHEFALDLQTDPDGNFYFAKGGAVNPGGRGWQTISPHNGTVIRITPDGKQLDVFATGVRAPNGMGAGPDGQITVADNEGTWNPTCRLNYVHAGDFLGVVDLAHADTPPADYGDPVCWMPMSVDNSSGGQTWVTSDKWGPFSGRMLHTSYGRCDLFLVTDQTVTVGKGKDEKKLVQGGVINFNLPFASGICRPRFNPRDGQLYVTGLKGWQTRAARDGCFQRVRYTGKPVAMASTLTVNDARTVTLTFTAPLDKSLAEDPESYAAERWNYRWTKEYGSKEYKLSNPAQEGHDPATVTAAKMSADGKSVTLTFEEVVPVMQQKLSFDLKTADGQKLEGAVYHTINAVPGSTLPKPGLPPTTKPSDKK